MSKCYSLCSKVASIAFILFGITLIYLLSPSGNGFILPAFAGESGYEEGTTVVLTPSHRSQISGDTAIEFVCPGGTTAAVYVQKQPDDTGNVNTNGTREMLGGILTLVNGRGVATFPADDYPRGPVTLRIRVWQNGAELDDCYLQLFNTNGVAWKTGLENAPVNPVTGGMSVTFADDYKTLPSISFTGENTAYASVKPDVRSGGQFGYAAFENSGGPYDPFSIADGEYLKIETVYRGESYTSPNASWNQKVTSGLISSLGMDGSGFHTQGGTEQYFEARIFCPPGSGMWPAFWTLTASNYADNPLGYGTYAVDELDILEGYMAWPDRYAIAWHPWSGSGQTNPSASLEGGAWPMTDTQDFNYINLAMGFHIFGVYITEDTTYYYMDNIQVASHPTLELSWNQGNYFLINAAVSSHVIVPGPNDTYTYDDSFFRYGNENHMYVDWVRVYEGNASEPPGQIVNVNRTTYPYVSGTKTEGPWSSYSNPNEPQNKTFSFDFMKGGNWWSDSWGWMYTGQGAVLDFSFEGTSIALNAIKGNYGGSAQIYLDGVLIETVNLYSQSDTDQEVFARTGLSGGSHTLRIINTGGQYIRLSGFTYS